jgi:aconitate hydratase 2/2-methylisocitrate dehydratase
VVDSWAAAEWFTTRAELAESITVTVFKVDGETNTDDLSPATHATTRPDIPLHALAMLETRDPNGLNTIAKLKENGHPVAYVGDVVGTGSSRKSAINSVLWHTGNDIPHVPNKRAGGVILGGKIAPIFFNTAEDSGALPIECDVSQLNTGDVITIRPHAGTVERDGTVISHFDLKPSTISDEVRAGGRIPLMIGRALTDKVRNQLGLPPSEVFIRPSAPQDNGKGFTLAQKMVGKACGLPGVQPGTSCEPLMATVGSQDTTGPMTRDEMKELACLGFSSDLVMQSFCHTAAYPKPVDLQTQQDLPDFFAQRGGVALRPGDGIIHSWLESHAAARHRRYGRGQSHPIPPRYFVPSRFRLGGVCRCHRRHAFGHAGVCFGAIQRRTTTGRDLARCGECHPVGGHSTGPAHGGKSQQKKYFQWPNHGDRRSSGFKARTGL